MTAGRLEVRAARPGDREPVLRLVRSAFAAEGGVVADLVVALDAADRTVLSLVAEVDGVLAGHVQLNRSWLDARERLVDVLVLSPLAVEPGLQRRGVGTALVEAAIAGAAASGSPAVFLEGSPDYYGARGFRRASELGFERPSVRIPRAAFQVVVLPAHEAWMTGRVVYCDPFWALDCVGLRDPLLAELEERFSC